MQSWASYSIWSTVRFSDLRLIGAQCTHSLLLNRWPGLVAKKCSKIRKHISWLFAAQFQTEAARDDAQRNTNQTETNQTETNKTSVISRSYVSAWHPTRTDTPVPTPLLPPCWLLAPFSCLGEACKLPQVWENFRKSTAPMTDSSSHAMSVYLRPTQRPLENRIPF